MLVGVAVWVGDGVKNAVTIGMFSLELNFLLRLLTGMAYGLADVMLRVSDSF